MPFDLTADDISIPVTCPILGIPLIIGAGAMNKNSPTLDRINPQRGYVKGNVAIISWQANKIKGREPDPEVFEKVAKYIRETRGG